MCSICTFEIYVCCQNCNYKMCSECFNLLVEYCKDNAIMTCPNCGTFVHEYLKNQEFLDHTLESIKYKNINIISKIDIEKLRSDKYNKLVNDIPKHIVEILKITNPNKAIFKYRGPIPSNIVGNMTTITNKFNEKKLTNSEDLNDEQLVKEFMDYCINQNNLEN